MIFSQCWVLDLSEYILYIKNLKSTGYFLVLASVVTNRGKSHLDIVESKEKWIKCSIFFTTFLLF